MPSQSTSYRDKASRPPQLARYKHPPSNARDGLATSRVPRMESNTTASDGTAVATTPNATSAAMEDVEMTSPTNSPSVAKKRSSSKVPEHAPSEEPAVKKQRTSDDRRTTPSPSPNVDDLITARTYTEPLFDDEPTRLLKRSIAMVLSHVGFDSASKEALESFCAMTNSYSERFLSYITEAKDASRRAQPILSDYEYALRRQGLTDQLLRPHLKPPVPKEQTQLIFELEALNIEDNKVPPELLGRELSGEADKLTKSYIPKKFPAFPAKHTYKATEVMPERETDPRKIREKATEAARHGEEALRRLVGIGKVSDQKDLKRAMVKSQEKKLKHELWEKAMADLTATMNGGAAKQDDLKQGISIDAEKKYGRQPVIRSRT